MRRIAADALVRLSLVLVLWQIAATPARAQGVTRICAQFISAQGAPSCVDVIPGQIPVGSTITGNASGTTEAVVGTLAGVSGRTTFICGFDVSSIGGTAATGPITIAGLVGSSMTYQMSSSAAGTTLSRTFTPCIPASAQNTAITITTTANGTATAVNVNSWGFRY